MKFRIFTMLCFVPCALAGLPAAADTRDDVLARAQHCAAILDGRKWLDCYYAAAQPLRSELGLAPAPQAQAYASIFNGPMLVPSPSQVSPPEDHGFITDLLVTGRSVPPAQFGLRNARPGPGLNVDHITAQLIDYKISPKDGLSATLANGQVWHQIPGQEDFPDWRKPAAAYVVTISEGAFGTFNLRLDGDATLYKVERIK